MKFCYKTQTYENNESYRRSRDWQRYNCKCKCRRVSFLCREWSRNDSADRAPYRSSNTARHHAFIASSRLKGRGWMESRLVGEKGGGTIGQISSATTDYSIGKWKGRRDVRVPLQFLIESSRARHLTISIQC